MQIIRTAAILQLLLGNIGRPGGGILALRGHASIQGSTDIPTLYDLLPGYLPMPTDGADGQSIAAYVGKNGQSRGWWANIDKYIVSLLKAWYGNAATADNDFGFGWLPRISGDHSHFGYWLDMADATGTIEGLFVMGQNPAVGAPNARLERRALANLKWLVVRDMVETETATFWMDSPEVARGELRTAVNRHRSLLPSSRRARREGRLLHQHAAAAAMARQGDRFARRCTQRCLVRVPPRSTSQGSRGPRATSPERGTERAHLVVPHDRTSPRTRYRRSPAGDQRPAHRRRIAGYRLRHARERRHDHVRVLDLFGCSPVTRS